MGDSAVKVKRTKEHVVVNVGESRYEGTIDNALISMAFLMQERNQLKAELEAFKKNNDKLDVIKKEIETLVKQSKAKNDKLQKVVDKLPTTEDGVPIVPGLRVFWSSRDPDSSTKGYVIHLVEFWNKHKDSEGNIIDDHFNGCAWSYEIENQDGIDAPLPLPDDFGLYSTAEALEKAKEKKTED